MKFFNFFKKKSKCQEKTLIKEKDTRESIYKELFDKMPKEAPSKQFASGAVFDIFRKESSRFEQIVQSNNPINLTNFFISSYRLFCDNPMIVGFSPNLVDKFNDDTDPRTWNADLFTLQNGDIASLCFMPIENNYLSARIIGIITGEKGDGYYYCMLNKNENVFSDVIRNKALNGIFKVGEVKGTGFQLMQSFLECIKRDYYATNNNSSEDRTNIDHSELIKVFEDTRKISNTILAEKTEKAKESNAIFEEDFWRNKSDFLPPVYEECKISVEENTTFAAAKKYLSYGKIAVLNFANTVNPGGGVMNGAMAQEECLCRSSNLYEALASKNAQEYYNYHRQMNSDFSSDRLIYTSGVTVFKDDSDNPKLMPEDDWFEVDVITCAAPYLGNTKYISKKALRELFKSRIKNIFEAALCNHVDCIILGAFGCGTFRNPPEIVASAFHEVIDDNSYRKVFKKIVFAIKRTSTPPCENIMAFEHEFYKISQEANILRFDGSYDGQDQNEKELPSGRILKGEELKSFEEWRRNNKYYGKQFSILGDSISTLEGYNPKGYNLFYKGDNCFKSGVKEMSDTWWGKVIDYFGGELLVNNSWSGSRVTKIRDRKELFPSGCSNERTGGLHIGSVMPDVIIIYLGTNDWGNGVRIDSNSTILLGDYDNYDDFICFEDSYIMMLSKIHNNYPNAEIWCCTLNTTFMTDKPGFSFPYEYRGKHIKSYCETIKSIALNYECNIIDLYSFNTPYDSIDGSHPSKEGMDTLANMIILSLLKEDDPVFLNIESSDETDIDYVDLEPNSTRFLYSVEAGIKLFSIRQQKEFIIKKESINIGRYSNEHLFELALNPNIKYISTDHAIIKFKNSNWFILDNNSTNGTWINNNKLEKGKWYLLHCDDVIDFAHQESFVFFKTKTFNNERIHLSINTHFASKNEEEKDYDKSLKEIKRIIDYKEIKKCSSEYEISYSKFIVIDKSKEKYTVWAVLPNNKMWSLLNELFYDKNSQEIVVPSFIQVIYRDNSFYLIKKCIKKAKDENPMDFNNSLVNNLFKDLENQNVPLTDEMKKFKKLQNSNERINLNYEKVSQWVNLILEIYLSDHIVLFGGCHSWWNVEKHLYKYLGVDWKTPSEMNSDIIFD